MTQPAPSRRDRNRNPSLRTLRTPWRRDRFPLSCGEIGIGLSRRSAWHAWIQCMSPRDDKSAPWAYMTIGIHEYPADDEDDIRPALRRATEALLRKAGQAKVQIAAGTRVLQRPGPRSANGSERRSRATRHAVLADVAALTGPRLQSRQTQTPIHRTAPAG